MHTPVIVPIIYTMYVFIRILYSLLSCMYNTFQATAIELRDLNIKLQTALEGARKEIAARKEHEAKLTSQLQVCLCFVSKVCHFQMCKQNLYVQYLYIYIYTEL